MITSTTMKVRRVIARRRHRTGACHGSDTICRYVVFTFDTQREKLGGVSRPISTDCRGQKLLPGGAESAGFNKM